MDKTFVFSQVLFPHETFSAQIAQEAPIVLSDDGVRATRHADPGSAEALGFYGAL